MTCPIFTGVFLVRACGAVTTSTCELCGRQVCGAHARSRGTPLVARTRCTDCLRSPSSRRGDDDDFVTGAVIGSSGSTGASPEPLNGGGGEFGGAGASSTWDDMIDPAGTTTGADPAAFTLADFAAFDAISDSDKDQGSPGYDS